MSRGSWMRPLGKGAQICSKTQIFWFQFRITNWAAAALFHICSEFWNTSIQECLLIYLINLCVSVQPSNKCGGITIHTVLSDSSHFRSCDYGTLPTSVVIKWGSLRLLVPISLLQYCHQQKPIFTNAFGK
jgi:hypothetical protein